MSRKRAADGGRDKAKPDAERGIKTLRNKKQRRIAAAFAFAATCLLSLFLLAGCVPSAEPEGGEAAGGVSASLSMTPQEYPQVDRRSREVPRYRQRILVEIDFSEAGYENLTLFD
jgi:hypothetical protein